MEAFESHPIIPILFKQIMRDAITGHIHRKNLLYDTQHGFLSRCSCIANLLNALNTATQFMDDGNVVNRRKAFYVTVQVEVRDAASLLVFEFRLDSIRLTVSHNLF